MKSANALPLVSIALATYNGSKYLKVQLESLLAQDYPNFEVVVSDDCSSDETWEILQSFATRDDRIRLLPRDINVGYVHNFIRVFRACRGGLISPCDQDDIWHPTKTRRLAEALGAAALVYCDSRFVNENGDFLGLRLSDTVKMVSGSDARNLLFCTSICGHAMLFRKSLLDISREIASVPYIDWALAFLAMEHSHVAYLDEALVDWRQHCASTSAHVRMPSQASRIRTLQTDEQLMDGLLSICTKNRLFASIAYEKWRRWRYSYFNLSMFFFVIRYGRITHAAHSARIPSLKYLFGYKLKKLLLPHYY